MLDAYAPQLAPGFAKHSSTFKNDDRCEATLYVVGDSYDDVFRATWTYFNSKPHIDYDVNYSDEGEKWVGVIVRDCE